MSVDTAVIQSPQNEHVRKLRRALARGERTSDGLVAIDSFHLLAEALASGAAIRQVFFTSDAEAEVDRLFDRVRPHDGTAPQRLRLSKRAFESAASVPAAQGVAALVRPRTWELADLFAPPPALVVMLAGVQDPGNAGTILRTAEAFGATGSILLHGTVHPENPKLLRATAGSVFRLPHLHGLRFGQALEELRRYGVHLYAAEPRARRKLKEVDFTAPLALAIGAEGRGLPEPIRVAAEPIGIPHALKVESLNAAMAAGIFLYEAAAARGRR